MAARNSNAFSQALTGTPKPQSSTAPKATNSLRNIGGSYLENAPSLANDFFAWANTTGNVTAGANKKKKATVKNEVVNTGNFPTNSVATGGSTGTGGTAAGSNTGSGSSSGEDTASGNSESDTESPATGGTGVDNSNGFAFNGQEPLSAAGRTQLVNDPYAFTNAWLSSLGGSFNTPTMLGVFGQFPSAMSSLDLILNGGDPANLANSVDDNYTLEQYRNLLTGQLTRGGGIDAWSAIQNILNVGSQYAGSPVDKIDNPLASTLLGLGSEGASLSGQADQVNNLIGIAMVNSNPIMAYTINNLLAAYKSQYVAEQAQRIDENTEAIPYVQWLRDKGILQG